MKEIREVIRAFNENNITGKKSALVSVVHVEGSSYRKPGARMLINDEGLITGAISGGCLEGDALRKALMVISQQQSRIVTYDTTDEDDVSIGVQLGCAGIISVLFEPIVQSSFINPVLLLQKAISKRQNSVIVTLFSLDEKSKSQLGTCLLVEEDKTITGDIPISAIRKLVIKDVEKVMASQVSSFTDYEFDGQSISAFIEFLKPPVTLVAVGAGNDAIPLITIADTIGWETKVVDGRNTHAKQERFISACQVLVSKPEKVLDQIQIDAQTVFVLMTHNYNYDLAMLKALLERKVRYIGVLGPGKRSDRMLSELKELGMTITEDQLQSIYGPVGLGIGAETPEEIALSIIAEIKAVLSGRNGLSLRNSNTYIHSK